MSGRGVATSSSWTHEASRPTSSPCRLASAPRRDSTISADSRSWYHDAIIYEVHVRAFRDENGDGVGDFRGLTGKLDYLRDLGVTAIWVLPFYPSPLRDDGYDIADYRSIHPAYGTMRDFRRFLKEAHERDLKVITELVINHTSDQHPWFQRARQAPAGSPERDFYVWSDDTSLYKDARIIFQDTESSNWAWDPVARSYYWHRFFSHQPDLNFENPLVHQALFDVLDFWLDAGVDGLRLDAVPYLYERDGTMCENLPETHEFLRRLRARVDSKYDDRMLLAEANQWPEDAVAYLGQGDECHMAFHFPVMPRLFMAVHMENRFPIIDILEQTPEIPESTAWAMFLRNHDELTLEMVTDEERDYMYRVYAADPQARINVGIRRRLAPLLGNDRRRTELMTGLLLSLPGTPVIYYGDEIGMGDNVYLGDRNGVRTPMQWSGEKNAGFSEANPQSLYFPVITDPEFHYESVNVEIQRSNSNSLWWWTKRVLALRKANPVLSQGRLEFVHSDNPKVLTVVRVLGDQAVLVVANLSRHAQAVTLDLDAYAGRQPIELLGRAHFPQITEGPYLLTPGAHDFFWLRLEKAEQLAEAGKPRINLRGGLETVWRARTQLQRALVDDIPNRRWFRSKTSTIVEGHLRELVEIPGSSGLLATLELEFVESEPETYIYALDLATGGELSRIQTEHPEAIIAEVAGGEEQAVLYDAMFSEHLPRALAGLASGRKKVRGKSLDIRPGRVSGRGVPADALTSRASPLGHEQSNSSVTFGDLAILKLFRKLEEGVNPEVEIGEFLTGRFDKTPSALGLLLAGRDSSEAALAFVQEYVPNESNAFDQVRDRLVRALEDVLAREAELGQPPRIRHPLAMPPSVMEQGTSLIGQAMVEAGELGETTGEMHLALGSEHRARDFAPEPMTTLQQRSFYQSVRSSVRTSLGLLRRMLRSLPIEHLELAEEVLAAEPKLLEQVRAITAVKIECDRIRTHGDFHLGQVLYTGRDYVIIDFEGEPLRPLSERRLKRLGLRDVAGMVRSYHYATSIAAEAVAESGLDDAARARLAAWSHAMHRWLGASYLRGYLDAVAGTRLIPSDPHHVRLMLDGLVVEKAAYELSYELDNRPEWVDIPLQGILEIVE